MTAILHAQGVGKRYGGVVALAGVDFAVEAGAVNVLIGENGAGKSTLMRILAGVEQPGEGVLLFDGSPVAFASVRDAAARGIAIVHQELNLCPNLSVAENIFLTRTVAGKGPLLDKAGERRAARALLDSLDQKFDPDTPVSALRVGQRQVVEIAKALAGDCRVLILDEPTSALSAAEVETLFATIGKLRSAGVAIVYISHRLEELLRIGDRITVMRDGRIVDTAPVAHASLPWIVERMLGDAGRIERADMPAAPGPVVLSLEGLSQARSDGAAPLDCVSADFRAGEITAIYGLLGAGRTELFEAVCGARSLAAGSVRLKGVPLDRLDIADRVARGVLLVPEDRQGEGLFANLSVGGNIGLADLVRFTRAGLISRSREIKAIDWMLRRLTVKAPSAEAPIGALSGGNQQKVVIGRTLMPGPAALLLDEPTRGIDVGARAEIFATMQQLAAEGMALIFSTSDQAEARTVADRILVMANGRITLDVPAADADETLLIQAANAAAQPETVH